jgi:hypothetical protein
MSELILQKKQNSCAAEKPRLGVYDFENGVPGVTMLTVSPTRRNERLGRRWCNSGNGAMKVTVTSGAGVTASAGFFAASGPSSILAARSTFV